MLALASFSLQMANVDSSCPAEAEKGCFYVLGPTAQSSKSKLPSSLCGSGRSAPVGGATLLWEWLRLGGVMLYEVYCSRASRSQKQSGRNERCKYKGRVWKRVSMRLVETDERSPFCLWLSSIQLESPYRAIRPPPSDGVWYSPRMGTPSTTAVSCFNTSRPVKTHTNTWIVVFYLAHKVKKWPVRQ